MANHSNRSRALKGKVGRKPADLVARSIDARKLTNAQGNASIMIRKALKAGDGKVRSRIPKAWQDTHVVKPVDPFANMALFGYASDYIDKALAVRARFNPNRLHKNVQTLRAWDPAKRKFVAKRIQIGLPGSTYQAPAHTPLMRGNPCLFDLCTVTPAASHTRKHKPCGVLPDWKPTAIVKRSKLEADIAVQAWVEAKQLAHALALLELGDRHA